MTQDEIIAMAREAGFIESNAHSDIIVRHSNGSWVSVHDILERFHALAVAAEREAWEPVLHAVLREMPRRGRNDGNAPGHAHEVPGIWDRDNGSLAGTECAWCKAWNTAKEAIRARGNHASS